MQQWVMNNDTSSMEMAWHFWKHSCKEAKVQSRPEGNKAKYSQSAGHAVSTARSLFLFTDFCCFMQVPKILDIFRMGELTSEHNVTSVS